MISPAEINNKINKIQPLFFKEKKVVHNQKKMSDNIKVMVRIRPFAQREISEGSRTCVWISDEVPQAIVLDSNPKPRSFRYDWTGAHRTTQTEIFNYIGKGMVDSCLAGMIFPLNQNFLYKKNRIQ